MADNPQQSADVTSIIKDMEAFTKSLIDQDFDTWLGFWAEDGVLMPPGQPSIEGRDKIDEFVRANFGNAQSMNLSNWDVDVEGDLAVAASTVSWRARTGEGGLLKQVVVLRRSSNGRWIRQRVIYNQSEQT